MSAGVAKLETRALLPIERTLSRAGWYARALPVAVVLGASAGIAAVHVSPLVMWAVLAAVLSWTLVRRRRVIAMLRDHEDAVHLVTAGEIERARSIFADLVARARTMPALHALFSLGLAGTELDGGEPSMALERLESVRTSGWIGARGMLGGQRPVLHGRLALAHAQRGDHDAAMVELDRAHALLPAARRGSLLLADAVVLLRATQPRDARARIAEDLSRARQLLSASKVGCIRMLAIWAARLEERPDYRTAAVDADLGDLLADEPTRTALLRLARGWPELGEFLAAHGVGPIV
jgi:tetratricopeptide (TPR) repeat protein